MRWTEVTNTKTLLDLKADCYCTVLWFVSEMSELHCRVDSLLTVTADSLRTGPVRVECALAGHRRCKRLVYVMSVSSVRCIYAAFSTTITMWPWVTSLTRVQPAPSHTLLLIELK